ncbi:hypothetical protein MMYC01_207214 [Madurella mycetomatis]|uniref:Heterokaryon incompatibility domain-containing protein n=1 Tax=Madurella mycetomatis TaxID=100816 RepID=A0A175W2A9_9PEZI|nr:hypothetical protein MMYC01_207214 [Madurella mycetomatis]
MGEGLISNVSRHQKAIRLANFLKTIRDTIDMTRCLGCKHFLANGLCIIQYSNEDPKQEASCMTATHENAGLTISTSGV